MTNAMSGLSVIYYQTIKNLLFFRSDSFTSYVTCSYEFLEACRDSVGPVTSALLRPYIGLLDNIFSKACSKGKHLNAFSPILQSFHIKVDFFLLLALP